MYGSLPFGLCTSIRNQFTCNKKTIPDTRLIYFDAALEKGRELYVEAYHMVINTID